MFTTNLVGDDRPELMLDGDNRIFVSKEDADARIAIVGEAHMLFPFPRAETWLEWGPAILAAPSTDEVIDQIGTGLTFALKQGNRAYGINLGVWVNPNADFPAAGMVPGRRVDEILYVTKTTYTFAVTVTLMGVN